ncbi:MAG: T9SS C-terminal target domain-containing protein [Gammaproteobacteria bacterium]|nr:T9SS C-terminal target domain-containing protein [Gammaproteobacteria bacterium]
MSYSVTGTNTLTGCTATAVRNVLVNPSPNITMIATPGMACPGTSVTMQASGAGTYIWSTGGNGPVVTITPSATAVYSVTGTLNGCATTQTLSLMVYNSPTVSASSSRNSMCVNENVTLTGSGAQSYQWMASNTSVLYQGSPISIMPTVAGPASYTVTGTDANGCTAKAVVNVNVEACTGISQLGASAIELYPNPNKGDFYVKSTDKSVFGVEVIDVTGKVVWNSTSQSSEIQRVKNQIHKGSQKRPKRALLFLVYIGTTPKINS